MLDQLRQLEASVRPGLLAELVGLFGQRVDELLPLARSQAGAGDAAGLRQSVHAIKGAAANLGGEALRALAAEFERQLQADQVPPDWADWLESLEEEVAAMRLALADLAPAG
jgi:HPt (histidine-containing phosphotransfer) domain-containing protein